LAKNKSVSLNTILTYPLVIWQDGVASSPLCKLLETSASPIYNTVTNNFDIFCQAIYDNSGIGFVNKLSLPFVPSLNDKIIKIPIKGWPLYNIYFAYTKEYYIQHKQSIERLFHIFQSII